MKKSVKIVVIAVVMMLLGIMLLGCATGDTTAENGSEDQSAAADSGTADDVKKIGFANIADTDLFCKRTMDYFVDICAERHPDWEVICTDANLDVNEQITQVETLITNQCDAIVMMPVDYEGIVPAIEKCNDAGIPVVCCVIDAAGGDKVYVGSSNYECGASQAALAAELLPEGAKYVYLEGTPGLNHTILRMDGFMENFDREDCELLAVQAADYELEKGMKVMEDWLQAFDQIDAIISANDTQVLGAVQALDAAGRLDDCFVIGVDGAYDAFVAIANGDMYATMFYNGELQATNAVNVIERFFDGETDIDDIITPFEVVDKTNVAEYMLNVYGDEIEVTAE